MRPVRARNAEMMGESAIDEPEFAATGIHPYVVRCIRNLPDLTGKVVLDIPAGDGRASHEFRKKGADVRAFDLFPEFMRAPGIAAEHADMTVRLPLPDESVDYVICQEGIEHIPDQPGLLAEFNRVLKPGGTLLLTTPSLSHIRARLSHFLFETDLWRRMPPTELDSVWFSDQHTERLYFGHLFLIGVHHLEAICSIAGFVTQQRLRTQLSWTSIFLGIFIYPILVPMTMLTYRIYSRKNPHVSDDLRRNIWWQHVRMNISLTTLFCKHTFWVLQKRYTAAEKRQVLKRLVRQAAGMAASD